MRVELYGNPIDDLASFFKLHDLKVLWLKRIRKSVTSVYSLSPIFNLPNLYTLDLSYHKTITCDDEAIIKELPTLKHLYQKESSCVKN